MQIAVEASSRGGAEVSASLKVISVLLQAGCEPRLPPHAPVRRETSALLARYESAWRTQEAVSYYSIKPRDVPSVTIVDFVAAQQGHGLATHAIADEARSHSKRVEGFDPESYSFLRHMADGGVSAMFIKGVASVGGVIRGAVARDHSLVRLADAATRASALVAFMYLASGWWGNAEAVTVLLVSSTSEELDTTQRTFTDAAAAWAGVGGRGVLTLSPWEDAISDDGSVPATSAVMQWSSPPGAPEKRWSIRLLAASPTRSSGVRATHTVAAKVVEVFGAPYVVIMTGSTAALSSSTTSPHSHTNRLCDVLIAHSASELRQGAGSGAATAETAAPHLDIAGAARAWESGIQAIDTYMRLDRHSKVWAALWAAVSSSQLRGGATSTDEATPRANANPRQPEGSAGPRGGVREEAAHWQRGVGAETAGAETQAGQPESPPESHGATAVPDGEPLSERYRNPPRLVVPASVIQRALAAAGARATFPADELGSLRWQDGLVSGPDEAEAEAGESNRSSSSY